MYDNLKYPQNFFTESQKIFYTTLVTFKKSLICVSMHCRVRMSPRGGVAVRGFVSGRGPPLRGGKDSPERAYRSRGLV